MEAAKSYETLVFYRNTESSSSWKPKI